MRPGPTTWKVNLNAGKVRFRVRDSKGHGRWFDFEPETAVKLAGELLAVAQAIQPNVLQEALAKLPTGEGD